MLKAGANVVIADLNYPLAKENSDEMNKKYGGKATIAAKVDVSNEDNVRDMVYDTVLEYGGLDIFVSTQVLQLPAVLKK